MKELLNPQIKETIFSFIFSVSMHTTKALHFSVKDSVVINFGDNYFDFGFQAAVSELE